MIKNKSNSKISSIIGPDVEVDGDMKVSGSILVYGTINGSVSATGSVRTAKDSLIKGDINSKDASICGNVEGHMKIENKTILESNAVLKGDLSSSIVVINEGASFQGLCNTNIKKDNKEKSEDFESKMSGSFIEQADWKIVGSNIQMQVSKSLQLLFYLAG